MQDENVLRIVGSIAGIGGLALGVFLLIFRNLIQKIEFPRLTREQGFKLMRLFSFFTWTVAIIGMALWAYAAIPIRAAYNHVIGGRQSESSRDDVIVAYLAAEQKGLLMRSIDHFEGVIEAFKEAPNYSDATHL